MYNKLDAINLCLTSVGALPVTSEDSPHPDVLSSKLVIDRVNSRLQNKGWWFNKELGFTLQPYDPRTNVDSGQIILPTNYLRVELVNYPARGVARGKNLYDIENNTFIWEESLLADIVMELDFNDLPNVAVAFAHEFLIDTTVHHREQ